MGKFVQQLKDGWTLVKESLVVARRYPKLLVPLFLTWIFIASCVLAFRYLPLDGFWLFITIFFAIVYSLVLSCLFLLELIQQLESGRKLSLSRAVFDVMKQSAIKALPIAFVWAILWFILLIFTPKKRDDDTEASLSDAAETLSGANSPFSLSIELLKKLLRMFFFLTLPAIAWEGKGPASGFKQTFKIVKTHPLQFLSTYALTLAAATLIALPLIPYYIAAEAEIVLPTWTYIVVIIYSGIVWTAEIYLEQMSLALLYMWHLKWVDRGATGQLSDVPQPSLLDEVHELVPRQIPRTAHTSIDQPAQIP
jgi:hypothetical protein